MPSLCISMEIMMHSHTHTCRCSQHSHFVRNFPQHHPDNRKQKSDPTQRQCYTENIESQQCPMSTRSVINASSFLAPYFILLSWTVPKGKSIMKSQTRLRFMEVQKEEAQCQALTTYPSEQIDFGFSSS